MMNKHLRIAFAGAIALAAIVSCNKEKVVENNPNFNSEEGTVKTQFVLNISTANTPSTKMTSANTQATTSETFRGMEDVSLMAYELAANGSHLYDLSAVATAKRSYNLGALLNTGSISESNSRRVLELSLPVGTNTLLFYGRAAKGTGTQSSIGSVQMTVADDANNTAFTIDPRLTAENQTIFTETADLIATCLTVLSNAAMKEYTAGVDGAGRTRDLRYAFYWPVNTPATDILDLSSMDAAQKAALPADGAAGTGAHASQTFHMGSISWAELGDKFALNNDADPSNDVTLTPLQEILGQAHFELTNIRSMGGGSELRAGSGSAMQYLVSDIFSLADRVGNKTTPSFWEDEAAALLGRRIIDILATCFSTNSTPVAYRPVATIKAAIETNVYGKHVTDYSHVTDIETFPTNIDLPMGAAILEYNTVSKVWSYKTALPTYGMGGGAAGTTQISKYLYPAELMYFGNSPVRVTDDAHETNHYPQTVATWDADATWTAGDLAGTTGWTKNGKVKSTTRSVAMQKDINYGTALLKTTVKYSAATLQDNNAAIQNDRYGATEPNNTITVADDSFELTGIIIGGAINTVGWNFVNKGSTYDYLIFDGEVPNGTIPQTVGTESTPVYTLLWDNWNSTLPNDDQAPVYVALEFTNNAKDFWGHANKVRKGGTFYLTGKLDPAAMAFPGRTATNYNLPPYANADGSTIEASRVFIQDFMTTASFTIGATSLQHAYVTVPDLRSSEISLGLSVDIKWETGLTFPDVVLGE